MPGTRPGMTELMERGLLMLASRIGKTTIQAAAVISSMQPPLLRATG